MELKATYKNTEIGSIPVDWEVKKLGEIAEIKRGKFTPRPRNDPRFYGGNIPFVQTGDVTYSKGKISKYSQTLNKEGLDVSILFKKGTILMTIAANIGYSGVLQIDMACPDSLAAINGFKNYDNDFLNCYFIYKRQEIDLLSTPGAQKNINVEILKKLTLPLPPTKAEQTAIATALNDADALITQLEKLIAKKRNIKQGTMQELLKPKEDWQVKKLGEMTTLMTNGFVGIATTHYTINDEGVLYIQGYNVEENGFNFNGIKRVTESFHKKHSKSCLQKGDLLTVQTGDVGLTTIVPEILEGSNCHALIITRFKKQKYLPQFFCYYLNSNVGRNRLKEIEVGTTMKHINVGELTDFIVPFPSLQEQTQIAKTLSDMDTEIAGLEKQLEKYKKMKVGMMQNLLTGKIRLV